MIQSSCFYKLLNVGSQSRLERTVPAQSKFSGEEQFHATPLICSDRFEINRSKEFVRPKAKLLLQGGGVFLRTQCIRPQRIVDIHNIVKEKWFANGTHENEYIKQEKTFCRTSKQFLS